MGNVYDDRRNAQRGTIRHRLAFDGNAGSLIKTLGEGHSIDECDPLGRTPLHYAAKGRNITAVQALLKHGADANAVDLEKRTPLHYAAAAGAFRSARALLAARANVEAEDQSGKRPLHIAAEDNPRMVKMLLAAGADVNAVDCRGWTPLHVAASSGREEIVRALLGGGADPRIKTKPAHISVDLGDTGRRQTAESMARWRGAHRIAELIRDAEFEQERNRR